MRRGDREKGRISYLDSPCLLVTLSACLLQLYRPVAVVALCENSRYAPTIFVLAPGLDLCRADRAVAGAARDLLRPDLVAGPAELICNLPVRAAAAAAPIQPVAAALGAASRACPAHSCILRIGWRARLTE